MKPCLIEELRKLKESSKEAVENIEFFSSFKVYMHVNRKVEDELFKLINSSSNSSISQLILVCGGVGDGKSHLISFLKKMNPQLVDKFYIHNDAT
jgi:DNA phosphorothioation-dependent restriction protein DptF